MNHNHKGYSAKIFMKYMLYELPGIGLVTSSLMLSRYFIDIPLWFIAAIVLLWIIKDLILFPFLWRAYADYGPENRKTMVGLHGTTRERLAPCGHVFVRGEIWSAEVVEGTLPIEKGENIVIYDTRGLQLVVQAQDRGSGQG